MLLFVEGGGFAENDTEEKLRQNDERYVVFIEVK